MSASGRSVLPDGDAIRRLRLSKGLRVEDLAAEAGCSPRTINNAERGQRVYPYLLKKIADALDVAYPTLTAADEPDPPAPAAPPPRVEVRLVLAVHLGTFDQTAELVAMIDSLKQQIGAKDLVDVKGVTAGSVVVTVELSEDDALRLLEAFAAGRLRGLRVTGVQLPEGHGLTTLDRFGRPVYRRPADDTGDDTREVGRPEA